MPSVVGGSVAGDRLSEVVGSVFEDVGSIPSVVGGSVAGDQLSEVVGPVNGVSVSISGELVTRPEIVGPVLGIVLNSISNTDCSSPKASFEAARFNPMENVHVH